MKIQKMLLYTILLMAIGLSISCGGSQASSSAPPDIRPGVKVTATLGEISIDFVVKEVRGNWVSVAASDGKTWINFDQIRRYYVDSK